MVLLRCRDPHAVVAILPVAEDENDSLLNVDRCAAKHRPRPRLEAGQFIEHELEWDCLRLPNREEVVGMSAFDHADRLDLRSATIDK